MNKKIASPFVVALVVMGVLLSGIIGLASAQSSDCWTRPIIFIVTASDAIRCLDNRIDGLGGSGPISLDQLTDVVIVDADTGEVLKYNGTVWTDSADSTGVGGGNVTELDDLDDVILASPTTGDALLYNGSHWIEGTLTVYENNTASNVGAGSQVFKIKSGVDLQFRTLTEGQGIEITQNANDIEISATATGNATVFDDLGDVVIVNPSLNEFVRYNGSHWVDATVTIPSGNATLLNHLGDVVIVSPATNQILQYDGAQWENVNHVIYENNTASNLGASSSLSEGLFAQKSGVDLQFKKLLEGSNISLSSNGTHVTITATGGGESTVCTDTGSGNGLCNGGNVNIKSLIAGNGVSISDTTDDWTIANTGVTSIVAGNGISINQGTGAVTVTNSGLHQFTQLCTNNIPSGTATSLSCSSFTAKKYLVIVAEIRTTTNTLIAGVQFNGDTGTNYAYRVSINGAADTTSNTQVECRPNGSTSLASGSVTIFRLDMYNNQAGDRKIGWGGLGTDTATAATTAPAKSDFSCKWGNTTDQITTVTINRASGSGVFNTGSTIWVYGSD